MDLKDVLDVLESARTPLIVGMAVAIAWLVNRLNAAETRERNLQERVTTLSEKLAATSERNAGEYRQMSRAVLDAIAQLERTVLARGRREEAT